MSAVGERQARPSLLVPISVTVTALMGNTLLNPALPDVLDDFGISGEGTRAVRAGLLVTAASLPGVFIAPVTGLLADRLGRRPVLVASLVIYGVAGLLSGLAPGFWWLFALRLGIGVGSAGLISLAVVVIGDHWEGVERAKALGRNAAMLTTTVAVFPLLGGSLAELGGWRWTAVPMVGALATAAFVAVRLPGSPRSEDLSLRDQIAAARPYLRQPQITLALWLGFATFLLIFGLFLAVLPEHLDRDFGLGSGARGAMLAAPAFGSTITALSLGRLRGRASAASLVLVGLGLFALGFVFIGLTSSLVVLAVAAMIYGVGEGLTLPTLQDIVSSAAPASSRGAVVSVYVAAIRAGQASGPLIAGWAAGAFGSGGAFVAGGVVSAALVLAVAVVRKRLA